MKRCAFIILLLIFVFSEFFSQTVVSLKVREKTVFRKERYLTVKFSVEDAKENFTDVDVEKGRYYYFLCLPEGNWKIDDGFVSDFESKVFIQQDGSLFYSEERKLVKVGETIGLLLGFEKKISISKPFKIVYPISEKVVSTAEMHIPENLWEGYSNLYNAYQEGVKLYNEQNYRRSADVLFSVIADSTAKKFSFYKDAREKSIKSLDNILIELVDKFNLTVSAVAEPEEKIKAYEILKDEFRSYVDVVLMPKINVLADTVVFSALSRANIYFEKIDNEIEAEKYRLDVKSISWLNTESGLNFRYRLMIDALAYAFSSESFWDHSDTAKIEFVLPDTLLANLKIFGLEKDYRVFQRICISKLKKKEPLFDEKFLVNLLHNSSYLPQPYYDMFLAIDRYLMGNYVESKNYIFNAFKRLTDRELIRRLEILRSMILVRQRNLSLEAISLYREGLVKMSSGDRIAGLDAIRRAVLLEPKFALANFMVGEIYFQSNDLYPAIIYFSKAISLDSNFVLAYERLFEVYKMQGNWIDARSLLEMALSSGNDFWIIWILLAQAYNELKLYDKAVESLIKAISYNPLNYEQYVYLGIVYSNLKRFEDAEKALRKASEIDPDRKEAYEELKRIEDLKRQEKQSEKPKERKK